MTVQNYLENLNKRFKTGISTEHTYRGDLQNLLESLAPDLMVTNEAARIQCGAPDYILTKDAIPVGYIEAKDIGAPLEGKGVKEQFDRYRASLDNLIFTDYLDFHFYLNGEFKTSIRIAEVQGKAIIGLPEKFEALEILLKDFCQHTGQTVTSSKKLAEMMAAKAKMLSLVIESALLKDEEENTSADSQLQSQLHAFKEILIHDIKPKEFADIYAQTIAYGMFAARLHDQTLSTFTRQEAAELIPKTNPFLRKLFQYIAGYDLDIRIAWIVDGLADLFRATDVAALIKNFGKATQMQDPIIHFYETFLSEYDPKLRKARGVWYTPAPVVNFIVRAVDDILKADFALAQGLADSSKTKIKLKIPTHDKRFKAGQRDYDLEVHKVQILDPATGTGTFLAEVVKQVYKRFEGQQGIWSNYVQNHLVPRLNGFELLMASYAMAHLKMDMLLTETGYRPSKEQRFKIYLTNSLEEQHPESGQIWANWLSAEANEANLIKRDTPVMVVLGNPPYAVSSSNKSIDHDGNKTWIGKLIDDYKLNLNEKKTNLDDDYIKFIRFGQQLIDKNGEGVLAYISNNSFIDGSTHRVMRKSLLQSFDKIYILDLHGSSKKKEKGIDEGKDENVFDIMQGVSINIFVKKRVRSKALAEVSHIDLLGSRINKYGYLSSSRLRDLPWTNLECKEPNFFFVPKNYDVESTYNKGFGVTDLFPTYGSGIKTERDYLTIHFSIPEITHMVTDFITKEESFLRSRYSIQDDSRDWKLKSAIQDLRKHKGKDLYKKVYYRAFDYRYTYYTGTTRGFIGTPGSKISNSMVQENYGLIFKRSRILGDQNKFRHFFITNTVIDINFLSDQSYCFPLYLYPEKSTLGIANEIGRKANLNKNIVDRFSEVTELTYTEEKQKGETFSPIDILDYIYAVLHSENYREKYKDFLKIDFPKILYPPNKAIFLTLIRLGSQLRQAHLFESEISDKLQTEYPIDGDNGVTRVKYSLGKVFINETQFFSNVPEKTWEYFIAGYQPAQRWLKERKGRQLNFDDINHYQKIIVVLSETIRIMEEIDKIKIE